MCSKEVTVINEGGLHLRPCGVLSKTCGAFKSQILLHYGERTLVGKSVLNVMAAGVKQGAVLIVECTGPDEEAALEAVVSAISSGLGDGSGCASAHPRSDVRI